jgi:hypothetical protein
MDAAAVLDAYERDVLKKIDIVPLEVARTLSLGVPERL